MRLKKNIAISENGFVFDSLSGESYSLNTVGVEIVEMLKDEVSSEEIKYNIMEAYDVDSLTIEKCFLDFVSELKEFNLIETNE